MKSLSTTNCLLFPWYTKFHEFLSTLRKRYSYSNLLMKAVGNWKCTLGQNLVTGVAFMGLLKAFVCLPFNLSIAKLHAHGVDQSACKLLADYLSRWLQRVQVGAVWSSWVELTKGGTTRLHIMTLCCLIYSSITHAYSLKNYTFYDYVHDNSISHSSSALQNTL